jgi:putative glutamine amidotransferase
MHIPTYKIGLTYTGSPEKHENYVTWILDKAYQIQVIKLCADEQNLRLVKDMDGIIISGGIDAHPENYGSTNVNYPHAPAQFNQKRDAFETAVVNEAFSKEKPVLGICRGMQLINCILGGTLQQDLGDEGNGKHRNEGEDKKHTVEIKEQTMLATALPGQLHIANSAHHQSVATLASPLLLNAWSDDDVAEGFEWKDKSSRSFLLGVQWHPERMYKLGMENSPLSIGIKELFLKAVTCR